MATIGLKYVYAAPYESYNAATKKPVYGKGFWVGNAIQADETVNFGNNPLYADNRKTNDDTDFTDGTLTLGIAEFGNRSEDTLKIRAALTGEAYHEATKDGPASISLGEERTDNYVGIGYVKTGKYPDTGERFYRVTWYNRVVFKPGSESATTKGSSTTWQTPSIEGDIYAVPGMAGSENIRKIMNFGTEEAALEALKKLANYTEEADEGAAESGGSEEGSYDDAI
ncbi:MAG: hypothetical protein NC084_11965 [Bacteroides sp.]|nr:hypothetical protein [Eubacterium sp.]MCM1419304.1 hypothetical protein [Roseburia sp.]MCM1463408.1 hypothetical protein [Bacteroides sp.]